VTCQNDAITSLLRCLGGSGAIFLLQATPFEKWQCELRLPVTTVNLILSISFYPLHDSQMAGVRFQVFVKVRRSTCPRRLPTLTSMDLSSTAGRRSSGCGCQRRCATSSERTVGPRLHVRRIQRQTRERKEVRILALPQKPEWFYLLGLLIYHLRLAGHPTYMFFYFFQQGTVMLS